MDSTEKLKQVVTRFIARSPTKVGNLATRFYKDRFVRGGWIGDGGFEKWKPRKKRDRNEKRRGRRATLVNSGRLKKSIRVIKKSKDSVTIGTDVEYAERHNEGFEGQVSQNVRTHRRRSHKRRSGKSRKKTTVKETTVKSFSRTVKQKTAKRQFMGNSRFLNRRIEKTLEHELKKELKREGIII